MKKNDGFIVSLEYLSSVFCFSKTVKEEPMDSDFTTKKKGTKRKRIKDEPAERPLDSAAAPV